MAKASLEALPFNNTEAVLTLAYIAEARHDFNLSVQIAQQVLADEPNNERALSLLVTSYLAQGNGNQALAMAQRLGKQVPTVDTHVLQAIAYAAQNQDSAAIAQFERALNAEEAGNTASSAQLRLRFGRFYDERGDLLRAKPLYEEALRIVPQSASALVALAQLETNLGNYLRAEQLYDQVIANQGLAHVLDHDALAGKAELALLQGDRAKAKALWDEAEHNLLDHEDINSFGHRRELAQLLLLQGEVAEQPQALQLMQQEFAIRQDAETMATLAWAMMANQQWAEAEAIAQQALERYPRHAPLLYRASQIAQQLGKADQSQALQQQAKLINPYVGQAVSVMAN
ncbi:MAG: tetratricopeptide repeat protein [Synechococcales cyanobacterium RM1_1_8]|nr:tetratricopeptide repeat protein [Synechococcales cyanobacterium RM1_1_8]